MCFGGKKKNNNPAPAPPAAPPVAPVIPVRPPDDSAPAPQNKVDDKATSARTMSENTGLTIPMG